MKKKLIFYFLVCVSLILYLFIGNYLHIFLFCPIKKITNLYCPGCGVTRMLLSIIEGDFYQAFRYNPLLFICIPFFIIYYIEDLYSLYKQRTSKFKKLEPGIWYFLILLFLVYGIVRNTIAFDFLAPTSV